MIWQAPDYSDVLEQRLQEARLELLKDPRLSRGFLAGPSAFDPVLLGRVVRDKLDGAARSGLDAIFSNLRLDAQSKLSEAGVDRDLAQQALDEATRHLTPPALPALRVQHSGVLSPNILSALTLLGFAALSVLLFAVMTFHALLLVCLVAVGGIPALMVRNAAELRHAGYKNQLLDEYPRQLCRQYAQELTEQVAAYEHAVNAAIKRARRRASVA